MVPGVAVQDRHVVRLAEGVDGQLPVDVPGERSCAEVAIGRQVERGELCLRSGRAADRGWPPGSALTQIKPSRSSAGNVVDPAAGRSSKWPSPRRAAEAQPDSCRSSRGTGSEPGSLATSVRDLGERWRQAFNMAWMLPSASRVTMADQVADLDGGVGVRAREQAGQAATPGVAAIRRRSRSNRPASV